MNEAQLECVHTINGQVIVIACPGAGKTTTLLARINHIASEIDELLNLEINEDTRTKLTKTYVGYAIKLIERTILDGKST